MKQATIPPPNYTQVPNALFAIMPDMEKSELKVVMAVCRMTAGWHKLKDRLTVTRLMALTGLSRQAVYDGIELAKERGILLQEETDADGYIYSLNIREEVSTEETEGVHSLGTEVSTEETVNVQPVDTQKKVQKKLSPKKKISKEKEISPEREDVPPKPPPPKQDARFGVFIKEIERRTSHITPRDYERLGELWDEHPDLESHIYALEQLDKRGVGFNHVYYEKCLFSFEDGKARQKNGGYLKATAGHGSSKRGHGTGPRDAGDRGNGDAGATQSAAGTPGP